MAELANNNSGITEYLALPLRRFQLVYACGEIMRLPNQSQRAEAVQALLRVLSRAFQESLKEQGTVGCMQKTLYAEGVSTFNRPSRYLFVYFPLTLLAIETLSTAE